MATRLPDIPDPPTRIDPGLKKTLVAMIEQVRELRGFTGDAAGVAGSGTGGTGTPVAGPPGPQGPAGPPGSPTPPDPPDPTPPPAPDGVSVVAGMDFVAVTTNAPVFTQGHGYGRTLVYGAKYPGTGPLPTFGSAALVHEFVGQVGSFASEAATQWHIWVVWRSHDGYDSAPQGGTNGTQVTTGTNVSNLLTALAGQITTSQLNSALNTRIDLIDAPSGTAGSVNARIATLNTTISARLNSGGDVANAIALAQTTANTAVTTANSAASQVTTVQTRLDRIQNYRVLSAGNDAVAAGHASGVYSETGASLVPISRSYMLVVFNATGIVSSQTYDVYGNGAVTAGRNAATLTADLNALNDSVSVLVFTHDEPQANLTAALQTALKRCGATSATLGRIRYRGAYILAGIPGMGEGSGIERCAGDVDSDPNAFTELQLQLVNGRPVSLSGGAAIPALSASVQQEITARSTADGYLGAQYTLRLDVAGHVVGFGFSNTSAPGAGPTSDFQIVTDRFSVVPPAGVGVPGIVPFAVLTSGTTTPAGEVLPAGVYMDAARIRNLEVVLARFNQAIITNAMIASLAADKITAGSLAVGSFIQSSAYTPGGTGFRIAGDGNVDIANAGRSRVFNLGASGTQPVLKVGSALEVLANGSATFSGALSAATGSFNGVFTGSLSGATGTFSGTLLASEFYSAASGKRVTINESGSNELRIYGDPSGGTGAASLLMKAGDVTGSVSVLAVGTTGMTINAGNFYSETPGYTLIAQNSSSSGTALNALNYAGTMEAFRAESFGTGPAILAKADANVGLRVERGSGLLPQLYLQPLPGRPALRTAGMLAMIYTSGGTVDNRTSLPTLFVADGTNWRAVADLSIIWPG